MVDESSGELGDFECPFCCSETDGSLLKCSVCGRDGCTACMPAGQEQPCPECEEAGGD